MKAKLIKRHSNNGGGFQIPERLIIHAMGEYIIISENDSKWYRINKRVDIKEGVYHASEFLEKVGLSAHFLVCPNGDLMRLRTTTEVAYHAKGNNSNTVGVEVLLEGEWSYPSFNKVMLSYDDWVNNSQYDSLVEISNDVVEFFDMDKENGILRHSDISPERKIDPGKGFKWEWYKQQLV